MKKVKSNKKRVLRRTHTQKNIKPMRFRQSLFWDVDPKTIDPKKHARYIIERMLDFGNDDEARWVYRMYPHSFIFDTVKRSRVLRPETRVLWEALTKQ